MTPQNSIPTIRQLFDFAVAGQPLVLNLELQSGIPLNYYDEQGQFVTLYPDGTAEYQDTPFPESGGENHA